MRSESGGWEAEVHLRIWINLDQAVMGLWREPLYHTNSLSNSDCTYLGDSIVRSPLSRAGRKQPPIFNPEFATNPVLGCEAGISSRHRIALPDALSTRTPGDRAVHGGTLEGPRSFALRATSIVRVIRSKSTHYLYNLRLSTTPSSYSRDTFN